MYLLQSPLYMMDSLSALSGSSAAAAAAGAAAERARAAVAPQDTLGTAWRPRRHASRWEQSWI